VPTDPILAVHNKES